MGVSAALQPDPPRRWWRCPRDRRLRCPSGHHFKETVQINDTGFIRCSEWLASERRECGRWIFVFAIRGGRNIVAEVTLDEKAAMRKLSTPAEMLEYLGIFPD